VAKRTNLAGLGGAVILFVAAIGSSQQAHGATVTFTIQPGPSATQQCTATIPWQEANIDRDDPSKNDTVKFETDPRITDAKIKYTVNFKHGTPFGATHTISGIAKGSPQQLQIDSHVLPGTLCKNTGDTCYYPLDISVNGHVCNSDSAPPFNSDGIIVKPKP